MVKAFLSHNQITTNDIVHRAIWLQTAFSWKFCINHFRQRRLRELAWILIKEVHLSLAQFLTRSNASQVRIEVFLLVKLPVAVPCTSVAFSMNFKHVFTQLGLLLEKNFRRLASIRAHSGLHGLFFRTNCTLDKLRLLMCPLHVLPQLVLVRERH